MMSSRAPGASLSRMLPSPVMSVAVTMFWLLLNNSVHPAHVLFGLLLGVMLPRVARALCGRVDYPVPARPGGVAWRLHAARSAFLLGVVVLVDVVKSNIEVAILILGPKSRIRSTFIEVPVSLEDPMAVAALAGICTMTPGTLSAEISADMRTLTIHCLHAPDPQGVIAAIHSRYERPLAEIFPCSTTQS
jgi:multicomponent K+:H+ antiporter subunit E